MISIETRYGNHYYNDPQPNEILDSSMPTYKKMKTNSGVAMQLAIH